MSTLGVFRANSSDIEMLQGCWCAFRQAYPDQVRDGVLTRSMVYSAAGMPGQDVPHHYGRGRRLMVADDRACGAMIVFRNSISTQIEWLGVVQDWRRSGMAADLIDEEKSRILSSANRQTSLTSELMETPNGMPIEEQAAFWKAMDFDVFKVEGSRGPRLLAVYDVS